MDPLTLSATPKAWLRNSVLGPHAGSFVVRRMHGRYSKALASLLRRYGSAPE